MLQALADMSWQIALKNVSCESKRFCAHIICASKRHRRSVPQAQVVSHQRLSGDGASRSAVFQVYWPTDGYVQTFCNLNPPTCETRRLRPESPRFRTQPAWPSYRIGHYVDNYSTRFRVERKLGDSAEWLRSVGWGEGASSQSGYKMISVKSLWSENWLRNLHLILLCGDITNDQLGISEETVVWGGNLPIYWDISCHLVVVLTNLGQVCHTTLSPTGGGASLGGYF